GTCVHHSDWMRLEQEAGYHTKVTPATANGPEQVGLLVLAGPDEAAIRQDDVGLEQVVDREPIFAREVSRSAPQGKPAYTRCRDDTERYGQAKGMRGVIDVAGRTTPIDTYSRGSRIHVNAPHRRQIDHQPIVTTTQPRTT